MYKVYRSVLQVELGERVRTADLDLSGRAVQQLIQERTRGRYDPDEPIVTPASLMNDSDLRLVMSSDPELQ